MEIRTTELVKISVERYLLDLDEYRRRRQRAIGLLLDNNVPFYDLSSKVNTWSVVVPPHIKDHVMSILMGIDKE